MRARPAPCLLLCLGLLAGCSREAAEPGEAAVAFAESGAAQFVGEPVCASCHPAEAERWRGSHHDLAMQEADETTVLGRFEDARLTHFGVTSRFFRDGARFVVQTEGPDGRPADFEVAYTFGVAPLQQYLVRSGKGRLQALPLAWDSRPADDGGQRWFALQADEPVSPDDPLHWTRRAYNWNSMCADCHSTGVRRGYDAANDRYETTWQSIDVSCEACHGAGSRHVAWARGERPTEGGNGGLVDLRHEASWVFAPDEAIAHREGPPGARTEIETCAPCHSRRVAIAGERPPGQPFLDGHVPALLEEGLYHADGQILDEVYVWGSFVQSRMFARGVTCSDCHDPHDLRIAGGPDAACASCHRREVFATPKHHGHPVGSPGASCVSCHMPSRTYMGVDVRRDHGFRVPRPDRTERIGVPNACGACHVDRSAGWAARAIDGWRGGPATRAPDHAEALHAGRRGLPGADRDLAATASDTQAPAIVRASALRLLGGLAGAGAASRIATLAGDSEPLVRMEAARAAERLEPRARTGILHPLLRDPIRAVRTEAARVLAPVPAAHWPAGTRSSLAGALAEYRAAQRVNADRPEAHLNLGLLHARLGELAQAREAYETAIGLDPDFLPAHLNLADLHRSEDRDDASEVVLRGALARFPDRAEVHHALGLLRVRQDRRGEALDALERAARLAPEQPRYAYVLGVALASTGHPERGLAVLERANALHPCDRDILHALASLTRDAGDAERAATWLGRLQGLEAGRDAGPCRRSSGPG